ncbi:MAG: hypothetical protein NZM08_03565, partial [Chitinophagales bacterium]|nr:hypothetical protein [Chitinophagales bacterium]
MNRLLSCMILAAAGATAITTLAQTPQISLETFSTGYTNPVDIAHCGDSRLFIVQKNGYIYICDSLGNKQSAPFLNISKKVSTGG